MQRLFKLNSVLLKYNNYIYIYIYNSYTLNKLLYQGRKPFFEEDYIIVENTIKLNSININININNKIIEDDWVEINNENYDLK